jgi:hypothetical protein
MASASAAGFAFEDMVGTALKACFPAMELSGWRATLYKEQDIRDMFGEQSLNGVDHLLELVDPSGAHLLFLFQEKWKLITNQREVSQFLDCCARILSRIPEERRQRVYRLWVTRSQPSANGEKSLLEGGAYTVQCMTSPSLLAQITAQMVCELLGKRDFALGAIHGAPSLLPEESPLDPKILDSSKISVAAPVHKLKVNVRKEG